MRKTEMISYGDARQVFQLFHEVCELGFDPMLWRQHLLEGFNRLVDAQVAIGIELIAEAANPPMPDVFFDYGWDSDRDRRVFIESFERLKQEGDYACNPFYTGLNVGTKCHVMAGHETLGSIHYRRHSFYNDCIRVAGGEDMLGVCSPVVNGRKLVICAHRPINSKPFRPKDMQMARMLMEEIGPCLELRLKPISAPSVWGLSRRKRQVLKALLSGLSEKQIAARMKISQNTVHEYITDVYRHYQVNDRAELLSRFISLRTFDTL